MRRLVEAARVIVRDRARWASEIGRSTGLSAEGVELGFTKHVEIDPTDDEIAALVDAAGDAASVHVVLSANIFVAPLRAIAIARAAAERVIVRPSRRDPIFARALVEAAGDPALSIVPELDIDAIDHGEVHVYGRDETIAAIRARARSGTIVRAHGAGMGVALVTRGATLDDAARALASDVIAFDQRGCLSPRVAIVEGDMARAQAFGKALHAALTDAERRIPRGTLADDESADAARWIDSVAFAGDLHRTDEHAVGVTAKVAIPPPGRHVHVVAARDAPAAAATLAPFARYCVAVGADDRAFAVRVAPVHARLSLLGAMQRPPLDGPVDLRGEGG